MDVKKLMISIIEKQYKEAGLHVVNKNYPFWKIKFFEGNAIGTIGEKFIKKLLYLNNMCNTDPNKIIHNEYDIESMGKKIEIKTARLGKNNQTFQFNGINPIYNCDLIICVGISENNIYYNVFSHSDISYIHNRRKHIVNINGKIIPLVPMNPKNTVNYKITISRNNMKILDNNFFINTIKELLKNLQIEKKY